MKQTRNMHRIGIAALSAAVLFPIAPVYGQDVPATAPPPVSITPPPVVVTPPPIVAPAPPPIATPAPVAEARPVTRPARPVRTATAAPRPRAAAPVRPAAPAPAAPAPVPEAAPTPAPVAEALPPPTPEPVTEPAPVETQAASSSLFTWLIAGGALLVAALAFFALRRRRRVVDDYYPEETAYEAPVAEAAPVAEPSFSRPVADEPIAARPAVAAAAAAPVVADEVSVDEADQADVDALAADSAPVAGRPWLEFLLRPVRAGTSQDDTIVQFELTVGNTGTVAAKDVKISTWMFAAGSGGASEMERMLITPPADASVSEVDIDAGDGARVDGEITMPKSAHDDTVLPVLVADARYRLPDGREGRTSASFAIGLPDGEELTPFQLDRASGLIESVEARLHGEPQRV